MSARSIQFRSEYKRGGVAGKGGGGGSSGTTATKEKKPGFIKRTLGKIRKKIIPTFSEQHAKAKAEGKTEFRSTRKKKKGAGWFGEEKGRLHYAATDKPKIEKKIAAAKKAEEKVHHPHKAKSVYEKATGTKVSGRGKAFAAARKAGKKFFMYGGKKYHTRLKGEETKKPLVTGKGIKKKLNIPKPELSGSTAKKIKRAVGAQGGGRIADAARRAQIHGFYSPDMGMRGRGPGMPGPNVTGRRDPRIGMRGPGPGLGVRGYAKGGLIKGKPKLAVKGW